MLFDLEEQVELVSLFVKWVLIVLEFGEYCENEVNVDVWKLLGRFGNKR